jgi:hypothetical protein
MLIYVKQQSVEPLASVYFLEIQAEQFWVGLEKSRKLPGLINDPHGELWGSNHDTSATYPFSEKLDFRKKGDAFVYHYSVVRESKDSPWKLQKAWRSDGYDRTVEEYPVP